MKLRSVIAGALPLAFVAALAQAGPAATASPAGSPAAASRQPATSSSPEYDAAVRKLMQSADSLRHAIQEMAQQPAGERRNRAIELANEALRDTQSAMVNAYDPSTGRSMGANTGDDRQGKPGTQQSRADGATVVLLPSAMAGNAQFANGCWVRFFDDKQFRGNTLTLAGPVDMPKMDVPGGLWRDWDSAVVGPRARVTTYDNENFHDRTAVLANGRSYPDLRDRKLGWFEEVKSARVSCG